MPSKAEVQAVPLQRHARKLCIPLEAPIISMIMPAEDTHQTRRVKQGSHERDILAIVAIIVALALLCQGYIGIDTWLFVRLDAGVLEGEHGVDWYVDEGE